jgi:hypothetical protein
MIQPETILERRFWRFWLGGLSLFALLIASNVCLMTDVAPSGIGDHQQAASAIRVDAIHASWQAAGVMGLAKLGMVGDLIFIGVYSLGAAAGGLLFVRTKRTALRRLGALIMVAAAVFCLTDYVETICQLVQALQERGSDTLAGIAAMVRPAKSVAFLITFFGLLAALALRRTARRAA